MRFERILSTIVILILSAAIISGIIRVAVATTQKAVAGLAAANP